MKNLILKSVLFLSLISVSISCNNDDAPAAEASIVGKWSISRTGDDSTGQEVLETYTNNCSTNIDYVEFLSNGVNNDVSYDPSCNLDTESGTWVKSGSTLTVTYPGETPYVVQVLVLNATTLKVSYEEQGVNNITVFTRI